MDAYEEAIETPFLLRSGIEISWIGIMQTIDFLPVRARRPLKFATRRPPPPTPPRLDALPAPHPTRSTAPLGSPPPHTHTRTPLFFSVVR
jgi:hypothetical protein